MELIPLETEATWKNLRVLILEDDIELSAVIDRVLKTIEPQITLDWAASAEEATTLLEKFIYVDSPPPYDLVIADIFLDGNATGIDFWRTCQELLPGTPVLLTSALSLDRFFTTVGNQSISPPYLQKPFTPIECKQMFQSMLEFASRRKWNPRLEPKWML